MKRKIYSLLSICISLSMIPVPVRAEDFIDLSEPAIEATPDIVSEDIDNEIIDIIADNDDENIENNENYYEESIDISEVATEQESEEVTEQKDEEYEEIIDLTEEDVFSDDTTVLTDENLNDIDMTDNADILGDEIPVDISTDLDMPVSYDFTVNTRFRFLADALNGKAFENVYRDQLTERAKNLYDDVYTVLSMGKLTFTTIDISSYWRPYGFDAVYNANGSFNMQSDQFKTRYNEFLDDFYAAAGAVIYDHPELFWFHSISVSVKSLKKYANTESSTGETAYFATIAVAPSQLLYPYANNRIDEYNNKVNSIVASLSSASSDIDGDGVVSDYEYLVAAHDYVCNRCVYGTASYRTLQQQAATYEQTKAEADLPTKYYVVSSAGVFLDDYNGDVVC